MSHNDVFIIVGGMALGSIPIIVALGVIADSIDNLKKAIKERNKT